MAEAGKETTTISRSLKQARSVYTTIEGGVVERDWGFHNERLWSYEESFKSVLEGRSIRDLIGNRSNPVVIDLMAPPRTVYDLLEYLPDGRGLAVSLPDHRIETLREEIQEIYRGGLVKWIPGDITHSETWDQVDCWLQGQKADLIMERAMGGLGWLPTNKRLLGILLNKAWSYLNAEGGVLLFETPRRDELSKIGINLNAWINRVKAFIGEVKYDPGNLKTRVPAYETAKVMIVRRMDSPSILPSI